MSERTREMLIILLLNFPCLTLLQYSVIINNHNNNNNIKNVFIPQNSRSFPTDHIFSSSSHICI